MLVRNIFCLRLNMFPAPPPSVPRDTLERPWQAVIFIRGLVSQFYSFSRVTKKIILFQYITTTLPSFHFTQLSNFSLSLPTIIYLYPPALFPPYQNEIQLFHLLMISSLFYYLSRITLSHNHHSFS